jgi:hypothetical protein
MKIYRPASLILAALFAATGMLFLFVPDNVLGFFNGFSSPLGMPQSPLQGFNFYLILAVGYMYLVTALAFMMYRHPENRYFSLLLINAKTVSSVLSLLLFLFHANYLVYLANFVVDGVIAIFVIILRMRTGRPA